MPNSPEARICSGEAPVWYALFSFSHSDSGRSPLNIRGNAASLESLQFGPDNRCQLIFEGYLYDQPQLLKIVGVKELETLWPSYSRKPKKYHPWR